MKNKKLNQHLQNLLNVTSDSIILYKKGVAYSRDREIRQLLSKGLAKRMNYANDLRIAMKLSGSKPTEGRTLFGMIYKVWADIKTTISTDKERTMLEDINNHNKYVIDVYTDMLKPNWIPLEVRTLLSQQRLDIAYINKETDLVTWLFV
jgi:uncharacterized protein (TIGR02284 family)